MSEEELYKLALSDVPSYSLLNEIFAIRDKRFPNEENDYTIKVYGSISLDVLNKYVKVVQENSQLKEDIKGLQCERQVLYNTIHDIQKANKQLNRKRKKAIPMLKELNIKLKDILKIGIDIKEISDIEEILKGDKK